MKTYGYHDIDGEDWQTYNNHSCEVPSDDYRESMAKLINAFYTDQHSSIDAVFCEGYMRGLNYALRMMGIEIGRPEQGYRKAFKKAARDINMRRETLLHNNAIDPDDDVMYSGTPFIDSLINKGVLDYDE